MPVETTIKYITDELPTYLKRIFWDILPPETLFPFILPAFHLFVFQRIQLIVNETTRKIHGYVYVFLKEQLKNNKNLITKRNDTEKT
jgi:hypothetical protein